MSVARQCEGCKIKVASKSYTSGDRFRYFCGECYVNRLKGKVTLVPLNKESKDDA